MSDNTDNRAGILRLNLNVLKIDKTALFKGAKGTYLDVAVKLHKCEDEFGHHCMVTQDLGKDRRQAGEQGPILGNGKFIIKPPASADWVEGGSEIVSASPASSPPAKVEEDDDDFPF